jgi:hypothetical protein
MNFSLDFTLLPMMNDTFPKYIIILCKNVFGIHGMWLNIGGAPVISVQFTRVLILANQANIYSLLNI